MVRLQQGLLIFAALLAPLLMSAPSQVSIYLPDDPIEKMPAPTPVGKLFVHKIDQPYDFIVNSARWKSRPPVPAGAINTMGNPPDSAWFTNRHAVKRMTREQLQRGAIEDEPPVPPFTVVGGKTEGVSPGFRIQDKKGRLYFIKVDPMDQPEMATSVDVIVSRFMYAIGYNVPQNQLLYANLEDFRLSEKAKLTDQHSHERKMVWGDFKDIVKKIPQYSDKSFRMLASLKIEGEAVGPFYYEDVRSDDPNDIVPHENRRDLRGLFVMYAWLNNTDARAGNTLDTVIEQNGVRFVKHYLIDFNSSLGSDSDDVKDPRLGHEFMIATPGEALRSILTLGLLPRRWERTYYPDIPAVGNFTAADFHPDEWKSDYPNPAFLSRLPDDDYWAAKQVMAFSDDDIRAIVETGRFSDSRVVDYLTFTLIERRDKIGRTFFSKVLPLDNFRIENGELRFDDLAVRYRCGTPQNYQVHWFYFDNKTGGRSPVSATPSTHLPAAVESATTGLYFSAIIQSSNPQLKPLTLTLLKTDTGFRIVGCKRYELPAG